MESTQEVYKSIGCESKIKIEEWRERKETKLGPPKGSKTPKS